MVDALIQYAPSQIVVHRHFFVLLTVSWETLFTLLASGKLKEGLEFGRRWLCPLTMVTPLENSAVLAGDEIRPYRIHVRYS